MTSLQQRLVKTGGRLVKHARYYWLLLAESHLTRRLFGSMVRRVALLPSARRVGERQSGSDFSGERDRGRGSVRGTGRKMVSFEFWDSVERQNRTVPRPLWAPRTKNSTGL